MTQKKKNLPLDEIIEFMLLHSDKFDEWAWETIEQYVSCYLKAEALGIVREKGEVIGLGFARTEWFDNLVGANEQRYSFAQPGDTIWIEEIVTTRTDAIPVLWAIMVQRFGARKWVAGLRHAKVKCWSFNDFEEQIISKLKEG